MLSYLSALIGFAAIFGLFALLVTSISQILRNASHLKHQFLVERLKRLFGELRDPDRFVAAMLTHPSLEGKRGEPNHRILTDPTLPKDDPKVLAAVLEVLGKRERLRPMPKMRWWPRTADLDKQTVKDIGQNVYEKIGPLVDFTIDEARKGDAFRWADALKDTLGGEDKGVQSFRGKLWMLATTAFPEAEGKAPAVKTYVAAFHDEAQASAADSFTVWMRSFSIALAIVVAIFFRLDAIRTWNDLLKADPARIDAFAKAAIPSAQPAPGTAPGGPPPASQTESSISSQLALIAKAPIPICAVPWKLHPTEDEKSGCEAPHLTGLVLSIVALSFGAPFWFEVLKSAINMKSSFTPDAKKK
jgi:hypothetical protein